MNYISLIQIIIFTVYILIVVQKFSVLNSISESFYEFMKVDYSVAFVLFLWSISLGLVLQWVYPWKEVTKFLFAITAFFLAVVPIAATYRVKKVKTIHYAASVLAIALGFAVIIVQDWPSWRAFIPLAVYVASIVVMKKEKINNFTFWTEVCAFGIIFSRLIFKP